MFSLRTNNQSLKTLATLVCLLLVSFLFLGFSWPWGKGKKIKQVKVGAILPLTGDIAMYGKYALQGLELAIDDAVNTGICEKDEIKLITEDTQAKPAESVAAFLKLVSANRISAVITATSGVTLAIKPIANKKKVVVINASAISTEIEDSDDYCFSVIPNAEVEGKFLADFAYKNLGKRKAGVLYRNDPSGKSFHDIFVQRFKELGGHIVYEDWHPPEERDFRAYISKIAPVEEMDVLFIASFGPEVALYLRQANEMGVSKQVLAYTTFYSPKVLEIAGFAANGVLFTLPNFDPDSDEPIVRDLKEKVFKKYNQKEVNYYIASHYDAMMLLINAIKKGNYTGDSIRKYIANLDSMDGITGKIRFDRNGGAYVPMRIFTVQNQKFVEYKK